MGKDVRTLDILKNLIRDEKDYALKAVTDKNFSSIWDDIEKVILELRDEFVTKIKSDIDELNFILKYEIEGECFEDIHKLQSDAVSILDNLKYIENKDFFYVRECFDKKVKLEQEIKNKIFVVANPESMEKEKSKYARIIIILDGVQSINDSAFFECKNLMYIYIPDSVTNIGNGAFWKCKSLTNIRLSNRLTNIGDKAFCLCESLTSIEIPDSVTNIGESAFFHSESLTSIEIPDSVTNIGNGAFWKCKSLTNIRLSNRLTNIGDNVFCSCESLTSIEIPDSVTNIGESAFFHCESLTSIDIPLSVKYVGKSAFFGCSNLTFAYIPKNTIFDGDPFSYGQPITIKIKKQGCYVATCVYGSYDCPEVWTLRRFRDYTLGSTWYGRLFIKTYYAISPTLVKWFGKTKWFKNMWKPVLDKMVSKLQSDGVEDSPYDDKMWR